MHDNKTLRWDEVSVSAFARELSVGARQSERTPKYLPERLARSIGSRAGRVRPIQRVVFML